LDLVGGGEADQAGKLVLAHGDPVPTAPDGDAIVRVFDGNNVVDKGGVNQSNFLGVVEQSLPHGFSLIGFHGQREHIPTGGGDPDQDMVGAFEEFGSLQGCGHRVSYGHIMRVSVR
jgi:hypothetical protein